MKNFGYLEEWRGREDAGGSAFEGVRSYKYPCFENKINCN